MDSEPGHSLIVWTVRLSVALYMASVLSWLLPEQKTSHAGTVPSAPGTTRTGQWAIWYRRCWTAAWVLCLTHVACAYHFQHHWSQSAALRHTAELTGRVTGLFWSGGLYVNYAFLAWWGMDVLRCQLLPHHTSPRTFHAVAAFMMFNATAVFGPRWWIAVAAGFCVIIGITVGVRRLVRWKMATTA